MSTPPRLSRLEILGAWLHLWTPRRGVDVPPVPWRRVWAGAAGLALLTVVVIVFVVPPIQDAKERGDAGRAREAAAAQRVERARLTHDQRATTELLTSAPLRPQLEVAVQEGMAARAASGELATERILDTSCEELRNRAARGRTIWQCLAATGGVEGGLAGSKSVTTGFPVVAIVAADRRSFAWCKENGIAGEGSAFTGQVYVRMPRACTP